jgi:hypothetical protein
MPEADRRVVQSGSFFAAFTETVCMDKNNSTKEQSDDKNVKVKPNAGSGGFNQGAEQEDIDSGTKVSDDEKRTGHQHPPGAAKTPGKERRI